MLQGINKRHREQGVKLLRVYYSAHRCQSGKAVDATTSLTLALLERGDVNIGQLGSRTIEHK